MDFIELLGQLLPNGFADPDIKAVGERQDPRLEPAELTAFVGRCLWDVFSNNHEVFDAWGAEVDIGSFRTAAGSIAQFATAHDGSGSGPDWIYLDFYMGRAQSNRPDLAAAIYQIVFRRLVVAGFDWRYVHPRLYLVDVSRPAPAPPPAPAEPDQYRDPSDGVALELEAERQAAEVAGLQASLDDAYRESVAEARGSPPPLVVQSYFRATGRWPAGWPPEVAP